MKKIASILMAAVFMVSLGTVTFASSESTDNLYPNEQILAITDDGIVIAEAEPRPFWPSHASDENTMSVNEKGRAATKPKTTYNIAEEGRMDFAGSVRVGYTLYTDNYATGLDEYYVAMNLYPSAEDVTVKSTIYVNGKSVWTYKGTGQAFKYVHVYNCKPADKIYIKWTSAQTSVDGYIDEY